MRIGLSIPQYQIDTARGEQVGHSAIRIARRAEELGLDSVWLSDHPFAVAPDGSVSGALEPLALLAAVGRSTARIDVGTLVLAATMRTPAFVAHAARTLGAAAPGRVVLGLGAGWYEPEHRAFGVELPDYRRRVAGLDAALQSVAAIELNRPRILLGGSGRAVIELAARRADVWNVSWDPEPEAFASLSRRVDEACDRAGRDPGTLRRSVGLTVLVASDDRGLDAAVERLRARAPFLAGIDRRVLAEKIIAGTPEECADRIRAYDADEVVIALLLRDDEEMLSLFAEGVVPLVKSSSR